MINIKVNGGSYTYTSEICGHTQRFDYITPFICQEEGCKAHLPRVDILYGKSNLHNRKRYYIDGTIGDI